jgi:hypothetical protein
MNPKRTDGGKAVTYTLAADVRELIPALADHFSAKEQRRVPEREIVERAIRALAKRLKI